MLNKIQQFLFPPSPYNKDNLPDAYRDLEERDGVVFVLWQKPELMGELDRIKDRLEENLKGTQAKSIKIFVRNNDIKNSTMKSRPRQDGSIISVVLSVLGADTSLLEVREFLNDLGFLASYQVKNSVPLRNSTPNAGEVVSMSFFQAKAKMSLEQFYEYWFCSHTPFALDIHPLVQYERNKVLEGDKGSPEFQGIVPLTVKDAEQLDMKNFFSADGKSAIKNALRILSDVGNFLDLSKIETVPMREFQIK